jgi:hypothetical protein
MKASPVVRSFIAIAYIILPEDDRLQPPASMPQSHGATEQKENESFLSLFLFFLCLCVSVVLWLTFSLRLEG